MIKAEIFEDRALILDARGRVWQVTLGNDDQPEIRELNWVSHETVRQIMTSPLARYVGNNR